MCSSTQAAYQGKKKYRKAQGESRILVNTQIISHHIPKRPITKTGYVISSGLFLIYIDFLGSGEVFEGITDKSQEESKYTKLQTRNQHSSRQIGCNHVNIPWGFPLIGKVGNLGLTRLNEQLQASCSPTPIDAQLASV